MSPSTSGVNFRSWLGEAGRRCKWSPQGAGHPTSKSGTGSGRNTQNWQPLSVACLGNLYASLPACITWGLENLRKREECLWYCTVGVSAFLHGQHCIVCFIVACCRESSSSPEITLLSGRNPGMSDNSRQHSAPTAHGAGIRRVLLRPVLARPICKDGNAFNSATSCDSAPGLASDRILGRRDQQLLHQLANRPLHLSP